MKRKCAIPRSGWRLAATSRAGATSMQCECARDKYMTIPSSQPLALTKNIKSTNLALSLPCLVKPSFQAHLCSLSTTPHPPIHTHTPSTPVTQDIMGCSGSKPLATSEESPPNGTCPQPANLPAPSGTSVASIEEKPKAVRPAPRPRIPDDRVNSDNPRNHFVRTSLLLHAVDSERA